MPLYQKIYRSDGIPKVNHLKQMHNMISLLSGTEETHLVRKRLITPDFICLIKECLLFSHFSVISCEASENYVQS